MTRGEDDPNARHGSGRNPYLGPRPFGPGQRLPNREREAEEVADLLISERLILLHAPSGAGKTSLLQAGTLPMLEGFHIAGPVRVDKPVPTDAEGRPRQLRNRYIRGIAVELLRDEGNSDSDDSATHDYDDLSLAEVLRRALPTPKRGALPLLVIDQLEEVLTLDPTDWPVKEQFFRELGEAVAGGALWVLLAMREDYMGGLDRYLRFLPGHLQARYRLDFLSHHEATEAIRKPAEARGVTITDAAAKALIDRLARTSVQSPDRALEYKPTPYVEPVQLQVVCRQLWKDVNNDKNEVTTIGPADVERFVDVEQALSRYYGDSVREVARELLVEERPIRDWFETQLITVQDFRSRTKDAPIPGPTGDRIVSLLKDLFLVNSDTRGGSATWYELAHDRLVPAVLHNNAEWRLKNLSDWELSAFVWQRHNRPKELLLPIARLRTAPAANRRSLADYERDYLRISEEEAGRWAHLQIYRTASKVLAAMAAVEHLVVATVVLWKHIAHRRRPGARRVGLKQLRGRGRLIDHVVGWTERSGLPAWPLVPRVMSRRHHLGARRSRLFRLVMCIRRGW